jgi:hypothetical protein
LVEKGKGIEVSKMANPGELGDALAKALNTGLAKNLFGPATEQLGLIGGDLANVLRFYINQNLQKVFTKWAQQRQNKPLPPESIGRLIPLIQLASLQNDEELHERWASLLERAVAEPDGVLPSFGQTLSQLTAEEARYLERLYERVKEKHSIKSLELGSHNALLGIYDERLRTVTYAQAQELRNELAQARLIIQDLERLGIIACQQNTKQRDIGRVDLSSALSAIKKLQKVELVSVYSLTEYGLSFIRAARLTQ